VHYAPRLLLPHVAVVVPHPLLPPPLLLLLLLLLDGPLKVGMLLYLPLRRLLLLLYLLLLYLPLLLLLLLCQLRLSAGQQAVEVTREAVKHQHLEQLLQGVLLDGATQHRHTPQYAHQLLRCQ
jgi:hypothetical protein